MTIGTIGIVSPGDMGQAVAARLKEKGLVVCVALDGRSERTRRLAAEAGLTDCGSLDSLVTRCDVVLSVIDPGAAGAVLDALLASARRTGRKPLIADCNALAPRTKEEMGQRVAAAGCAFIDGGIIGPPPRGKGRIRLYVSGTGATALSALACETIDVRVVSDRIGDAAAIKMCYGGVTKGLVALGAQLLVAAERLGIAGQLDAELQLSQPAVRDWLHASLPPMPPKAYRWVPETREIDDTFAAVGLSKGMMDGAADLYAAIAATPLGRESPEAARTEGRSGQAVAAELARSIGKQAG